MRSVLAFMLMLAMALSAVPASAAATASESDPYVLVFSKSDPDGLFVWTGNVSGDVDGALTTRLTAARQAGSVLHVDFDWEIDDANGARSFVARMTGVLNLETGQVVMNGTVVEGWLEGARVHEKGQLVDPATSTFVGTIRVMPAST